MKPVKEQGGKTMYKKRIGAWFLAMVMIVSTLFPGFGEVYAADQEITIDLSVTDGEMIPKTGWLLAPNENIPDGRILPLNTRIVRDDIDTQNYLGNNGNGNSQNQLQDVLPNEGNRLERIRSAATRLDELGIRYYPILGYFPSWVSNNGMPQGQPKNYDVWKQWVKDIVQYVKDNDLPIDEFNVWNENWSINTTIFNNMYEQAWYAAREIMPDAKLIGPSSDVNSYDIITGLTDFCEQKGITQDIVAWHFGDYKNLSQFQKRLDDYISQKPAVGKPKYYYEEYTHANDGVGNMNTEMSVLSKFDEANVDEAIRGIWSYANGLSDMLVTNQTAENPYARNKLWWLMAAYGSMSGIRVKHEGSTPYVASIDAKKGEVKILAGGSLNGEVQFTFNNQPFTGENIRIDKYKLTNIENDGLQFQSTETHSGSSNTISTNINFDTQDIWMIVIKKEESIPSDFCLISPDDGFTSSDKPVFTWQKSQGAKTYQLEVAEDKGFSNIVYRKNNISGESHTIEMELVKGQNYYWRVTAENEYGTRSPYNDMYYTFVVSDNANIPGSFTMLQVIDGDISTSLTPKISWTPSRNVEKYRIHISKDSDFGEETVIEVVNPARYDAGQSNIYLYYNLSNSEALEAETTYYAKVSAQNSSGIREMNGTPHSFITTTEDGKPSAFEMVYPKEGDTFKQRETLRWEESVGAFFYKLEIAEDEAFKKVVLERDTITVPAYTLEENVLKPETRYYWRVTAMTKDLSEELLSESGARSFTASEYPAAPIVKSYIPTRGGAVLLFNEVQEAQGYKVKYGNASKEYTKVINTDTSPCFIPFENEDDVYYCTVTAVRKNLESESWNEIQITSGNLEPIEIQLDTKLEAESAPDITNVDLMPSNSASGSIAVGFKQKGAEIAYYPMVSCNTINIYYQAEQDSCLSIYRGDEKVTETEIYRTSGDTWKKLTIRADFEDNDVLRIRKDTSGGNFAIDYVILERQDYETHDLILNRALGKEAKADSSYSVFTPDKAVDGSNIGNADFWAAGSTGTNSNPNWLTVNLGAICEIYNIELALPNNFNWGPRTQNLRVLVSENGEEYTEIFARQDYRFDLGQNGNKLLVYDSETPLYFSYIKVEIYNNTEGGPGQIGELYVWGKYAGEIPEIESDNLALKKPVTADAVAFDKKESAVDGDNSTWWGGGSGTFPNNFTVDLLRPYLLEKIEIALPKSWGPRTQELSVSVSENGIDYTTVQDVQGILFDSETNDNTYVLGLENGIIARYVRVTGYSNDEAGNPGTQIGELRVFGSKGEDVSALRLSDNDITLRPGKSRQLTVEFEPVGVVWKDISWSSNDNSVAMVDKNGLVTAIGNGSCYIRARSIYGNVTNVCMVTVDDSTSYQDLQEAIKEAEAAKEAAEAAQAEAEAARAAAEAAKTDAEGAKEEAEAAQAKAEAAQAKAEAAQAKAEAAQARAEAAQVNAEEAKAAAEAAQARAEAAQAAAEAAQAKAEAAQAAAEAAKLESEAVKTAAEAAKAAAEAAQRDSESQAAAARAAQLAAEQILDDVNATKEEVERAKAAAAESQAAAENARNLAEQAKADAEAAKAESERIIETAKAEIEAAQKAAEEAKDEAVAAKEEAKAALEAAQEEIEKVRQEAELAKLELEEIKKKAEAALKTAEEAMKAVEELQKAIEAANQVKIEKGKVYQVGMLKYKVTNASECTAAVSITGSANKSLAKVTIPQTVTINGVKCKVTAIGKKAFKGYKKLTDITIGANVKNIGKQAFEGDSNLKKIIVKSKSLKYVGKKSLKGISAKAVIKVPKVKKKAYTVLFFKKGQAKTVVIK